MDNQIGAAAMPISFAKYKSENSHSNPEPGICARRVGARQDQSSGPDSRDADFKKELTALIPHLRAFARSLVGKREGAEDLAQETLIKAWQSRASFIPGTNLKAWLFTIQRNQCYSQSRRRKYETAWAEQKGRAPDVAADDQLFSAQLSDVSRALHLLDKDQREALILVGAAGLTYEEAALVLNCPAGTVKSRVSRGRMALMKLMSGRRKIGDAPRPAKGDASREIMAQIDDLVNSHAAEITARRVVRLPVGNSAASVRSISSRPESDARAGLERLIAVAGGISRS